MFASTLRRGRWLAGLAALAAMALVPQGAQAGTFKVSCTYIKSGVFDPIVAPGANPQPGGHLHQFFGNPTISASSDQNDPLLSGNSLFKANPSKCINLDDANRDKSAYWVPALMQQQLDGSLVEVKPDSSATFYYVGDALDTSSIRPFPHGFRAIVGDKNATAAQDVRVVRWQCLGGSVMDPSRPQCIDDPTVAGPPKVRLQLNFQNCWDGSRTDSPTHQAHVLRSFTRTCPATHPVPIPRLQLFVTYPTAGGPNVDPQKTVPGAMALSSGSVSTMHGDFMNAWNDQALGERVAHCLRGNINCNDVHAPGS